MNILLVTAYDHVQEDRQLLNVANVTVRCATTGAVARDMLSRQMFDAILLSAPYDDCSLESMLGETLLQAPHTPVIVRNRVGYVAQAIRCIKAGVLHYFGPDTIGTETEIPQLAEIIRSRHLRLQAQEQEEEWMKILVGRGTAMRNVAQVISLVATHRCNVLITGETGTGKEIAARAIHAASARVSKKMVAVNCSALPENLLEAELFGHTKGAFTGAQRLRIGRFEEANKSTLFLDEIADLPLGVQTKLLRVLQEREVQRLGSSECIKVDFRLVAACNVDLLSRIRDGVFREDLYYRLSTVPLPMPALRDRREDIPLLVEHFLNKVCTQEQIPVKRITDEAMDRLSVQNWPGNVRQLENAVEMAITLSGDRNLLHVQDFRLIAPVQFRNAGGIHLAATASEAVAVAPPAVTVSVPNDGLDYEQVVSDFERQIIRQALARTNGNKKAAADILRLKRTTLNAKVKSLEAVAS
jgi:DNA-binding NtrC family response regulator